ncbi:hypothetical protein [Streptomyces spectabilis]|uniref:Uncharacterized protein n=1 Tax=Streptomyces spectabilis TaxID=68270 RepID=A0A516RB56_STRST|nr:hypothetical protein [Streptomyces spectabilis]QDQ12881.1 hypothetical protein FH965_21845 [Streptomyces spectabilis]
MTVGATVAGLAAALVLTGCSSDGDDGGDKGRKDKGAASGGPSGAADSGAKGGSLEGSWVSQSGGRPVGLVITGGRASLIGTGQVCNGTAGNEQGRRTIKLKCSDGGTERSEGRVESVSGTTLKVLWEGHGKDEFVRAEGGKLPEGLPTAGLPQG